MGKTLEELEAMREKVVGIIRTIYDPEIPVNIYDLGLIYGIDLNDRGDVDVKMTLTSPSCPAAEILPPEVEQKIAALEGVNVSKVHMVWEPTWTPEMMSEEAKLELNMY